MKRFSTYVLICLGLLFIAAGDGNGTPEKYTWRQQTLIGANETHFFYYETVQTHPGSYYEYSDEVSLCRKRRADFVVDDTIIFRKIRYAADSWTFEWSIGGEDTTLSFDIAKYLQENHVCPAIRGMGKNAASFDQDGIYLMKDTTKVIIVPKSSIDIQTRIAYENPQVIGSWVTAEPWRKTPKDQKQIRTYYYLLVSGSGSDEGYAEDIIVSER